MVMSLICQFYEIKQFKCNSKTKIKPTFGVGFIYFIQCVVFHITKIAT